MKYYLKCYDYYLADVTYDFEQRKISNFVLDINYKRIYDDYELAKEDKDLLYIETGLKLEIVNETED